MRLIFNADDFGISKGCNAAIIDCFKEGFMTSTSLMVNMPQAKQAAMLMKHYPQLSVGIHLNLTVGYPLSSNVPTLVKQDGTFNKGNLKESSDVSIEEIRTELYAQMNRFIELTGQLPTHINSHHGIELIQGADVVVEELAEKYQLPVRHFFTRKPKSPFEVPIPCIIHKEKVLPEDIINYFTEEQLNRDDVYEIPVHPGYVDYELLQLSSLTLGRCQDAYNFSCDEIKQWINEHHIEIISYEQLRKWI